MGLFDALFGDDDTTSVTSSAPWEAQQPYLKEAFKEAQRIYNEMRGSPFYQGPLYARMTPMQRTGANRLFDFAGGRANDLMSGVSQAALMAMQSGQGFGSNAATIFNRASVDPTQSIISAAGQYASNPFMDQMVDAATRDVSRALREDALPTLANTATATGNTNSTRAGIAEGLAKRGAADRIADISAQLRGGAYSQGLDMAQGQFNQNIANQIAANAQMGDSLSIGAGLAGQGQQMGFANADAMTRAGSAFQQDEQRILDEAFQRWLGGDQRAMDLLNRYMGIVSGNLGNTTVQTTSGGGQSPIQSILGAAGAVKGLFGW